MWSAGQSRGAAAFVVDTVRQGVERVWVEPMLATGATTAPVGPEWVYELKWDGIRAIVSISGNQVTVYSRSGTDITPAFPELADLGLAAWAAGDTILDGELVVIKQGIPDFGSVVSRMHATDPRRARRNAAENPAALVVFDVLKAQDEDVRDRTWRQRRELLEKLGLAGRSWVTSMVADDPETMMAVSREHGLEGLVAKRVDGRYQSGRRSRDWVKVKHFDTEDFLIGGWRDRRDGHLSLLIGKRDDADDLVYRGQVGTGLATEAAAALRAQLESLRTTASPFNTSVEDARDAAWVEPRLVVEVRYTNRDAHGRVRTARFVRLRPDR